MTLRLVSKQVLAPTEPIELPASLPTLEFEGKFSPGFKLCAFCILKVSRLYLGICLLYLFIYLFVRLFIYFEAFILSVKGFVLSVSTHLALWPDF